MTPDDLLQILLSVPAHEPLAVALLRERRQATGDVFPSVEDKRAAAVRAIHEIESMAVDSAAMTRKLLDVRPIPVTDPDAEIIGGYCL